MSCGARLNQTDPLAASPPQPSVGRVCFSGLFGSHHPLHLAGPEARRKSCVQRFFCEAVIISSRLFRVLVAKLLSSCTLYRMLSTTAFFQRFTLIFRRCSCFVPLPVLCSLMAFVKYDALLLEIQINKYKGGFHCNLFFLFVSSQERWLIAPNQKLTQGTRCSQHQLTFVPFLAKGKTSHSHCLKGGIILDRRRDLPVLVTCFKVLPAF